MAERTPARLAAGGAAACVGVGVAAVTLAVVAGPAPGPTGYVSEAGVVGSGYAWTYRIGVFALATALLLLAAALRSGEAQPAEPTPAGACRTDFARPTYGELRGGGLGRAARAGIVRWIAARWCGDPEGDRGLRIAAGLLVASGLWTLLSGAVTCSTGCPLPPFERATVADLVHGGASIAATAAVVFAMITIVLAPTARRPLRRIAVLAATVALPLAGTVGLAMLFAGRGSLVGVLERLLLAVAALWGLATALVLTAPRPAVTPTAAPAKRITRPPWPTGPSVPSGRRRDAPHR